VIVPLTLLGWDLVRRRYFNPRWLLAIAALAGWFLFYHHHTGYWFGNPQYFAYNLSSTAASLPRIGLALLRRSWQLAIYDGTGLLTLLALLAAGPELPQRHGARSQGQNREIRNGGSLPGSDSREGARSKRRKAAAGDGEGAYMDVRDRAGFGENAAPRRLSPRPAPLLPRQHGARSQGQACEIRNGAPLSAGSYPGEGARSKWREATARADRAGAQGVPSPVERQAGRVAKPLGVPRQSTDGEPRKNAAARLLSPRPTPQFVYTGSACRLRWTPRRP